MGRLLSKFFDRELNWVHVTVFTVSIILLIGAVVYTSAYNALPLLPW